jgi:hypothetical protein
MALALKLPFYLLALSPTAQKFLNAVAQQKPLLNRLKIKNSKKFS